MNAKALSVLARAADDIADLMIKNGGCSESSVGYLRRPAEDARREAEAASGYSTESTLMLSICLDNDTRSRDVVAALVSVHRASETARADLADALRDWIENAAGTEGVTERYTGHGLAREIVGDPESEGMLSPIMQTLVRSAITSVDWIALATIYLEVST